MRAYLNLAKLPSILVLILIEENYMASRRTPPRRYFEQALDIESQPAQYALGLITQLYQHEKHIRNAQLQADKALEYCQKNSEPIMTYFFNGFTSRGKILNTFPRISII